MTRDEALLERFTELAGDVGHLRRRIPPESSARFVVERVADQIEILDAVVHPSAAELACAFFGLAGDWDVAVEEALREVDDRGRLLRRLLARETRT